MSKLAVLGDKDFTGIFSLIGADSFFVEDESTLREALEAVYKDNFAVLIIPEGYLEKVENLKKGLARDIFPIILSLPDERGSLGLSRKRLSDFIKKATGAEVV